MLPLVRIQWNWGDSIRLIIYSLIKEIPNLGLGTHSWLQLQGSRITAFMTKFLHLFLSIEFIFHGYCYLWQEMNHYQRKLLNASEPLEALRDEQRFRGTFYQAAVGIVHLATDGRWLLVNHRLRDLVGYTKVVSI